MAKKSLLSEFIGNVTQNVAGMLGISFYILADTFFISLALGAEGLAALNFALAVFSVMYGLGLMIGIGGAARRSILLSLGKKHEAETMLVQSLFLGGITALILMTAGIFFSPSISEAMGADYETIHHSNVYMSTMLCFSPCFILNYIVSAYVRNDGNSKISMAAMLISSMANIVLDYIFIFRFSMGMYGAVFATGLSPIISLTVLCIHLKSRHNTIKLVWSCPKIKRMTSQLKLGLSSFIGEFSAAVTVTVFNLVLLKAGGNTAVAAYGIIANTALVASSVFNGISQGMQPLASRECSDLKKRGRIVRYSIFTSVTASLVLFVSVFLCAEFITAVFNSGNDPELAKLSVRGMRIYFSGFLFAGLNIVTAAFYSAVDMPKQAFVISLLRSAVVVVPMVLILGYFLEIDGVWLSFAAAELVTCIAAVIYIISSNCADRRKMR
ncbi:MAG: MATE family efflux transporter [Ruminococcus sp.]|nr:MATE family efflux transporter [Ruminococcus sp.]